MCSKENWCCSFSGERRSSWWWWWGGGGGRGGAGFWMVNTWGAPTWKRLKRSTNYFVMEVSSYIDFVCKSMDWFRYGRSVGHKRLKLFTHISNGAEQERARVFSNNESFIFNCNNLTSFESVFYMKTVKNRLFKKYLKRRKSRFCLSYQFCYISGQINIWKLQFSW